MHGLHKAGLHAVRSFQLPGTLSTLRSWLATVSALCRSTCKQHRSVVCMRIVQPPSPLPVLCS